jgi:hypothetical protein
MRLYVVVEGQTAADFVKQVLAPPRETFSVWAAPVIVTARRDRSTGAKQRGGGPWAYWRDDLNLLSRQRHANGVRFTKLFDLHGHPPDYGKTLHGPLVMEDIGLPKIRAACPRFDAWVGALEALGAAPHAA